MINPNTNSLFLLRVLSKQIMSSSFSLSDMTSNSFFGVSIHKFEIFVLGKQSFLQQIPYDCVKIIPQPMLFKFYCYHFSCLFCPPMYFVKDFLQNIFLRAASPLSEKLILTNIFSMQFTYTCLSSFGKYFNVQIKHGSELFCTKFCIFRTILRDKI